MNFLSLIGVELKKIRRSKTFFDIADSSYYNVDPERYQCRYELRFKRYPNHTRKQLFYSRFYGYGLVYDPSIAGYLHRIA